MLNRRTGGGKFVCIGPKMHEMKRAGVYCMCGVVRVGDARKVESGKYEGTGCQEVRSRLMKVMAANKKEKRNNSAGIGVME